MYCRAPCGWNWRALAALGLLLMRMTAVAQERAPAKAHIEAALLHYKNLDYENALEELDRAQRRARTQEDTVSIYLYEGIILAEMNRDEEAAAAFEGALRLQPDSVLPLAVAPKIKERFEATREAVKAQARAEQRPPEPQPQAGQPVPLPPPQPLEAPPAEASKPAVTRDTPELRPVEPQPMPLEPRDEIIPRELAAEEDSPFSIPRLLPEMLGGAGGAIVGGGLGLVVGLLISPAACSDSDDAFCSLGPALLGLTIGAGVGLPIGTYGAGRLLGGRGGFGFTFLGMLLGGAVGTGIALLTSDEVGVISVTVGALGGAALGFELSQPSSGSLPGAQLQANAALSVLPIIGVTPQGGLQAGLTGRF